MKMIKKIWLGYSVALLTALLLGMLLVVCVAETILNYLFDLRLSLMSVTVSIWLFTVCAWSRNKQLGQFVNEDLTTNKNVKYVENWRNAVRRYYPNMFR